MNKLLVIDFGSQFNQVIIKTLRSLNIVADLIPYYEAVSALQNNSYKGIILSGGPQSVFDDDAYTIDNQILESELPILGICYGMQYLAQHLGGRVEGGVSKEYGKKIVTITKESRLTEGLDKEIEVWMSHNDSVTRLGDNFEGLGTSDGGVISIIKHKSKEIYGVQFHIEVTHTKLGSVILDNFAKNICMVKKEWFLENYLKEVKNHIKETVGDDKVLCAISGGVDSNIVGMLLKETIPAQTLYIFIDTGLLREGEADEVLTSLKNEGLSVVKFDASQEMFNALRGLIDPEDKRKAIGRVFIESFSTVLKELKTFKGAKFLAQGTLFSDIIESGTKTSKKIKSHHNVGGLPDDMEFKLLEPLKFLFKDEARTIGKLIGMPNKLIYRQPFPGPGLGIRIIGEVTKEKVDILKQADSIVRGTIENYGLKTLPNQYFVVLTDSFSVGVKGDNREYARVLAIRAVESKDFMTATFARLDFSLLEKMANEICNNVNGVSRVVYDITSKPPGTIEWE